MILRINNGLIFDIVPNFIFGMRIDGKCDSNE